MNTEENDNYNNGLSKITKILYNMRRVEHSKSSMSVKYSKAKVMIENVTNLLIKKKNFLLYRPMWNELHDCMVYYYDFNNKRNLTTKTPIFNTTLHNEVVKWWLKYKKSHGKLSETLLHFDTHDDMGVPDTRKHILTRKGKIDYPSITKGSCGKIDWPVTCILLSKSVTNVVWCIPKWVYDSNITIHEQVLTHSKKNDTFTYIRSEDEKKDKYKIEGNVEVLPSIEETPDTDFYHLHEFSRVKSASPSGWRKLLKLINTEKFILDIDLDFFVTNGDSYSKEEYKEDFGDLESTGRTHGVPGITSPRAVYEDGNGSDTVNKLNKEVLLIKKRVSIFLKGLSMLKSKGLTPCCINISDSAPSFFSGSTSRAVWTNSYTPKYFVPMLHVLLIPALKKMYKIK